MCLQSHPNCSNHNVSVSVLCGLDEANKLRIINNNNKEKPPLPRVSSAMRKSMTSSTNGLNTSTMSVSGSTTPKEKEAPRKTSVPERRVSSVRKVSVYLIYFVLGVFFTTKPINGSIVLTYFRIN